MFSVRIYDGNRVHFTMAYWLRGEEWVLRWLVQSVALAGVSHVDRMSGYRIRDV